MDYNFYFNDSGAIDDPANAAAYGERMRQSYLAYFRASYEGDRAPLSIRLIGAGLLLSWTVAIALALSAAWLRVSAYDAVAVVISGANMAPGQLER